jgi:hypothetical protein
MKRFLIRYRLQNGSADQRRQDMVQFIAALEKDPAFSGKISYRCMKGGDSDYYHLVAAEDDAVKALQGREFFTKYTEQTKLAAGGEIEVLPLEIVAETQHLR